MGLGTPPQVVGETLYQDLGRDGLNAGKASANCFFHPRLDVRCVVHGDGFTFSGSDEALNWIQGQMEKKFLCKIEGRMGGTLRTLNRPEF